MDGATQAQGPSTRRSRTALVGMSEAAGKGVGGRERGEADLRTGSLRLEGINIKEGVSLLPRNMPFFIGVFRTTSQYSLADHQISSVALHQHRKKRGNMVVQTAVA